MNAQTIPLVLLKTFLESDNIRKDRRIELLIEQIDIRNREAEYLNSLLVISR